MPSMTITPSAHSHRFWKGRPPTIAACRGGCRCLEFYTRMADALEPGDTPATSLHFTIIRRLLEQVNAWWGGREGGSMGSGSRAGCYNRCSVVKTGNMQRLVLRD